LPLPIKGKNGLLGLQARTACLLSKQARSLAFAQRGQGQTGCIE